MLKSFDVREIEISVSDKLKIIQIPGACSLLQKTGGVLYIEVV